ncbi:MAG: ABC transporter substrate-binding protein, partial [Acidimicrobiales bacterium]
MSKRSRAAGGLSVAVVSALVLAACGSGGGGTTTTTAKASAGATTTTTAAGGGSSSTTSTGSSTTSGGTGAGTSGGTATVLMGTAPDSLDPQFGYTTQAAQPDWITYTPLITYAHKSGMAGTQLIPGLATALPVVSNSGKTYTMTLRKGLKYSNGKPVKASDFAYSIERALKLNWGGDSFYTSYIAGAAAYQKGTAKTVSGITSDDATGKITVNLIKPYGAFDNVLAFPSSALVPSGTPMKNLNNTPPPGVGAYMITKVVP